LSKALLRDITLLIRSLACGLAVSVLIASLGGCARQETDAAFTAWVQLHRCVEGLDGATHQSCKGKTQGSTTLEFHLYPSQRFALVKVIAQDPKNRWVDLYRIEGCDIYDAANWSCTVSGNPETTSYSVIAGDFVYEFSGIPEPLIFAGRLHEGAASWWKRKTYE